MVETAVTFTDTDPGLPCPRLASRVLTMAPRGRCYYSSCYRGGNRRTKRSAMCQGPSWPAPRGHAQGSLALAHARLLMLYCPSGVQDGAYQGLVSTTPCCSCMSVFKALGIRRTWVGTSEFFLPLQCIPQGIPRGRRNPVSPVTVSLPLGKFSLLPWHSWAPLCHAVGERTAVIGRPISHHSRPPEGSGSQVLCVCVRVPHRAREEGVSWMLPTGQAGPTRAFSGLTKAELPAGKRWALGNGREGAERKAATLPSLQRMPHPTPLSAWAG